ncbi:MAG: tetratricopeptide repeat protein [Gallionella sp.]
MESAQHKQNNPSPEEMNTLGALFGQRLYMEAATLAKALTVRYPLNGIGWTVLGVAYSQMGRNADALEPMQKAALLAPGDADAHSNLGNTLRSLGKLDEAEASCRRALQIKPDFVEAHSNLGNTLRDLGRLDEAEASYRMALQIKPDFVEAHSNLGNALRDLGRLDEAEASYRLAMQFRPAFAEAHCNLGNTLRDLGRLDEAEASYRLALKFKPAFAEAHCNLGNTLRDLGRLDEAEASYRLALQAKPDFVDALNNLALLFNEQGKSMMALNIVKQSLQIKETEETKSIFVACLKRLSCTRDDSEIRAVLVRALTEPWGRPVDLARVGIELVKLDPVFGGHVKRAADAWPMQLSAQDLFGSNDITRLAADPLLIALLASAPIIDIEMERFLTMARYVLLEAATAMKGSDVESDAALSFHSALARQCFINEYVFSHTDDEIRMAGELRDTLVAKLETNSRVPAHSLVAVAAYFPLNALPNAAKLLEMQWSGGIVAVLVQQIREPAVEMQLRATIPRLTGIEDSVSLLVQNQYEQNPYPRWVRSPPVGQAKNIDGYLCKKFPLVSFKRHAMSGCIDILVAGCGTGQHSIDTAQRFLGAKTLAIDLSICSLGYAKRKTNELGLSSIEYAQADILKLGSLGRSFDIIESAGVLHHLADPWAGWRILLSLLRPDGLMRLGFYSEVARRDIVRIRNFIVENGYGDSANEIRRFRQDVVGLDKSEDFGITLTSSDFFSISECRDLLFHVQEHRITLASIDEFLREHDLKFLGFDIAADVLHAYKQRFQNDRAATNLGQWQIFENENPDTFIGMYQFWVQSESRVFQSK